MRTGLLRSCQLRSFWKIRAERSLRSPKGWNNHISQGREGTPREGSGWRQVLGDLLAHCRTGLITGAIDEQGSRDQNPCYLPVSRMYSSIQDPPLSMQTQFQFTSEETWSICTISCILPIIEVNGKNCITHPWHVLRKPWNEIITDFSGFILTDEKKNLTS